MIVWEEEALRDREKIFEFLYAFNPIVAEKTDEIIEYSVDNLIQHPLMGVQRLNIPGRLLVVPDISMIISYWTDGQLIRVMRVLHQKQKFPE